MKKQYPSMGDRGTSKLSTGQVVGKDHANFEAIGTVDELNCVLGWAKGACDEPEVRARMEWVQGLLLDLGSHVSGWAQGEFSVEPVERLEGEIAAWQTAVPDIPSFILPGGSELAGRLHIARAVCRRAERAVAQLSTAGVRPVSENALRFINRLSDWLYMAARWANVRAGVEETRWQPGIQK